MPSSVFQRSLPTGLLLIDGCARTPPSTFVCAQRVSVRSFDRRSVPSGDVSPFGLSGGGAAAAVVGAASASRIRAGRIRRVIAAPV